MSTARKSTPPPLPKRTTGIGIRFDNATLTFLRRLAVDHAAVTGGRPNISEIVNQLIADNRAVLAERYRAEV